MSAFQLWQDDQVLQANISVPGPAVPSLELSRGNGNCSNTRMLIWKRQLLISVNTQLTVTVTFATFQAKDYELRQYETAKWVSTVIRGESQKEAMRQGFWKLFHYIQGKNEKGRTSWF